MNSQIVQLVIEGRPQSKDNEKNFDPHSGRSYTSKKFKIYEANAYKQAYKQMVEKKWFTFLDPVYVRMIFYFKNNVRLDLFNSPKSICDALNMCVWKDDRQIVHGELTIKFDPHERIEIEVMSYELFLSKKASNGKSTS